MVEPGEEDYSVAPYQDLLCLSNYPGLSIRFTFVVAGMRKTKGAELPAHLRLYISRSCIMHTTLKHVVEQIGLTLNAPITTEVVCFLVCLNALIGAVCSGSTLYATILNLSVLLGNYLQQTTSADDIFRCISFLVRVIGLTLRS